MELNMELPYSSHKLILNTNCYKTYKKILCIINYPICYPTI